LRPAGVALGVALVLACGCWVRVRVPEPEPVAPPAAAAEALVLRVDEGGLVWGDGHLGDEVRRVLLASGHFDAVHYPLVPPDPPTLQLDLSVEGGMRENPWNLFAGVLTAYTAFLASAFMPFYADFELHGEGVLSRDGRELRRFPLDLRTHVTHALFAGPERFQPDVRARAYTAAAQRVLSELARPPGAASASTPPATLPR
jgi:hypothetical protein